MIQDSAYLDKQGWNVDFLYDVTCDDAMIVARRLSDMGAGDKFIKLAKDKTSCSKNVGMTYTNMLTRETLVVVGRNENPDEIMNTAAHETMHAVMHITEALGLDPYGEDPCYIMGALMGGQTDTLSNVIC